VCNRHLLALNNHSTQCAAEGATLQQVAQQHWGCHTAWQSTINTGTATYRAMGLVCSCTKCHVLRQGRQQCCIRPAAAACAVGLQHTATQRTRVQQPMCAVQQRHVPWDWAEEGAAAQPTARLGGEPPPLWGTVAEPHLAALESPRGGTGLQLHACSTGACAPVAEGPRACSSCAGARKDTPPSIDLPRSSDAAAWPGCRPAERCSSGSISVGVAAARSHPAAQPDLHGKSPAGCEDQLLAECAVRFLRAVFLCGSALLRS
jgi:hypothetical protein